MGKCSVDERGDYALSVGEDALPYVETMTKMTSNGDLLPEQIWDSNPITVTRHINCDSRTFRLRRLKSAEKWHRNGIFRRLIRAFVPYQKLLGRHPFAASNRIANIHLLHM